MCVTHRETCTHKEGPVFTFALLHKYGPLPNLLVFPAPELASPAAGPGGQLPVLTASYALSPAAPALFLYQTTSECHFANGTAGEIWFLDRDFWDRQECLRFDSRRGSYQAISELCKDDERDYNRDTQWMEYMRGMVENYCRYNYDVMARVVGRTGEQAGRRGGAKGR